MAGKQVTIRVAALSLMGGAAALYAAQAGVLPGLDFASGAQSPHATIGMASTALQMPAAPGQPPRALAGILGATDSPANRDADIASAGMHVPDAFAHSQTHLLPPRSGFDAAPEPYAAVLRVPAAPETLRPAAFSPAARLVPPGLPAAQDEPDQAQDFSPFGLPCGLEVTAEPIDAAMIALGIVAPCHPGAEITITHADVTVSHRSDAVGLLTLDLPALESPATVSVRLPDGSQADARVAVADLDAYDRVALAWHGDLAIELHALENGAAWMSEGHRRPDAPGSAAAATEGRGFLTLLGDPGLEAPLLAHVYTVPRRGAPGSILSIDAPITADNCARTAEARLLRAEGGNRVEVTPIAFTYPGCDAVGDTLVLQNPFPDLRLAAN